MTAKQHHRGMVITAIILAIAARAAAADPAINLHMRSPSHVVTDGGSKIDLPPGYFMDEPSHDKLDAETKRLQDAETRLTAENKSLKGSLAGYQPGFYTIATVTVLGIVLGAYLETKL